MTPKQRFLTALEGKIPDRLPVTTHHLMTSFLNNSMGGISNDAFFARYGLDPIRWIVEYLPEKPQNLERWRLVSEPVAGQAYPTKRHRFITPKGELSMVTQSNEHTSWVLEHLIKESEDIDLLAEFCSAPQCDVAAVNKVADELGDGGLVRGHICCFDIFGQPGCWQDAACLVGIENLIMATYDDPEWVHQLLEILQRRKLAYVESLKGARYDLLELGGGDASSTVISPKIFDLFVAPYDSAVIEAAHAAGQRIVYHTCGGMMPLLERIADTGTDAMETFTPRAMGGDTDLAEAKRRIGKRVCMIGGFDQFHYFTGCKPEDTRREVRRCFAEAGEGGGFILCPSDHFFEADPALLEAFADEARRCSY